MNEQMECNARQPASQSASQPPAAQQTLNFISHSSPLPADTKMYQSARLAPLNNPYESTCLRCGQTVYQVDRVGPLKELTFFHNGCFKCYVCGTRLTLKTYFHSQHDAEDKDVYCASHVPRVGPGHLDGSAVGIRSALSVPKSASYVNEQIRAGPGSRGTFDAEALNIKTHLNQQNSTNGHQSTTIASTNASANNQRETNFISTGGRFDASALHIAHALRATKLQRAYTKPREQPIHTFLPKEDQTELEMKHRREEDDLYHRFARQREEEQMKIKEEIREEWEKELEKLTHRFEREMNQRRRRPEEQKVLTLRHQQEKDDLEKNMTLRRDKKSDAITRKLLEHERAATAALVEKQSREMMSLINEKRSAFMRRSSETLKEMRHRGDSHRRYPSAYDGDPDDDYGDGDYGANDDLDDMTEPYPANPPPPSPPKISKEEIYSDPAEFSDIDQIAISVAQEDQKTFTDLVRQLVGRCTSDVEKARTIFRWITVKNLNAMHFDEDVRTDTPMGLLRGIKHGTESYHVLFKRLCSYAGLHCVVIKGYSKSAGYQPGVRFEDSRFRNSWNAVYVAGAWRFVQCNWGARHLVNAKEAPQQVKSHDVKGSSKSDSLRYEYDDHYFLTDPAEFIYEFFPLQSEWQLLREPLTLRHFEELPFVRSLFFRYGLNFPDAAETRAVMRTDATGAATIRIAMPEDLKDRLIFHYNLKLYSTNTSTSGSGSPSGGATEESDAIDSVSLKRFVMQSVSGGVVAFRVHAPCAGAFLLDVFANAVTPREYLTGEPMKFKSVCKLKMECDMLQTVMVPLPDCASGEWGPAKAQRLFGLEPLSHPDALVFAGRELTLRFRMRRPLADFMAALHKNGADERRLSRFVSHTVEGSDVIFRLAFPEEGQYGLDIYTREAGGSHSLAHHHHNNGIHDEDALPEKHLLTHCCKYLINSSKRN